MPDVPPVATLPTNLYLGPEPKYTACVADWHDWHYKHTSVINTTTYLLTRYSWLLFTYVFCLQENPINGG